MFPDAIVSFLFIQLKVFLIIFKEMDRQKVQLESENNGGLTSHRVLVDPRGFQRGLVESHGIFPKTHPI